MGATHIPAQRFPRKAVLVAGILLLVLLVGYSMLEVFARSPFVTSLAERYLSEFLQQPVSLQGVDVHLGTISLKGLTIGKTAGSAAGGVAAIGFIDVRPAWSELLLGTRVVNEITFSGVSVDLVRDRGGEWNFAPLLRSLRERRGKGESAELLIRHFRVNDGVLTLNGNRLDHIAVDATDIATKGTKVMQFKVTGRAPGAGRITLSGTARLGSNPVADVAFEAPSLDLRDMHSPQRLALSKGKTEVLLKARLRNGVVTGDLAAAVAGVGVRLEQRVVPLALRLRIPFRYDLARDHLSLELSRLQVNRLTLHGSANLEEVRGARKFGARLQADPAQVADIAAALPGVLPVETCVSGRLLPLRLTLAGDASRGVTEARGDLSLREGNLVRRNKVIIDGVAADLEVRKGTDGWQLRGRIKKAGSPGPVPFRDLTASFSGRFDQKMRPVQFEISELKARVAGSTMSGSAVLNPSAAEPFTASAEIPSIFLRDFTDVLGGNVEMASGEAAAGITVTGRTPADFRGKINLSIRNAAGKSGEKQFSATGIHSVASIRRVRGVVTVDGELGVTEGAFDGKRVAGDFRYGANDDSFFLGNGHIGWGDVEAGFERIAGGLPLRRDDRGMMPLRLSFHGVTCRKGEAGVHGLRGSLDGVIGGTGGRAGLIGSAEVADAVLSFRRAEVGTIGARLTFAGPRGEAEVFGDLLGGKLSATIGVGAAAGSGTVTFDGDLLRAEPARLSAFAAPASFRATGGTLDAAVRGAYGADGLSGTFSLSGEGISVAKGKKTTATGAGFMLKGRMGGDILAVQDGRAWVGPGLKALLSGEVGRPFSRERQGVLRVRIPAVPVAALLDSFVNVLPRPVQEATADGMLSVDSMVKLQGSQLQLNGNATVAGMALEIPAQQLSISDIRGTIPFSVDIPPTGSRASLAMQHPSRESYAGYLHFLQYGPHRGELLSIGKMRFGAVELGDAMLRLEAADGMIRITSFRASLAEGVVVGRGYFGPGGAGNYGGDLLVNDFSLRAFCSTIPAVKDYISGKVDGIVSLAGSGKGAAGLNAFIDLWARGTKEEKMLVSKEFLQKLAGKNLRGLFFRSDRPYDRGEVSGYLEKGYLTFETLDISHTNFFGVKDLSVSVAPVQNKIALDHLFASIRQAAARGKGAQKDGQPPPAAEFSWEE